MPQNITSASAKLKKENTRLKQQIARLIKCVEFPELRQITEQEEQLLLDLCEVVFPGFEVHIGVELDMRKNDTTHIVLTGPNGAERYFHWLEILDIIQIKEEDATGGSANAYNITVLHREIVKNK